MAIELGESSIKLTYEVLGEQPIDDFDGLGLGNRMSVTHMAFDIEYSDAWTVTLRGVQIEESGRKTKKKAQIAYGPVEIEQMPSFARLTFDKVLSDVKGVFG